MESDNKLVRDIGERGLIERIKSFCAAGAIGDDGAILDFKADRQLVVTTDVLVDGVHFSDRTTSGFDVGWRSAAANLSDLAAMGANPVGITVGLSLPGETPVSWVDNLYRGMRGCLQQFDTPIVGGDLTRSQVITVAITAFGEVLPHRVISRHNARVGDAILITGYHGLSKAGLELLLDPALGSALNSTEKEFLIKAHQRPQPRLDVVAKLREIAPDALVAGMDSSDGLADAIAQICHCSKVGAAIDYRAMTQCPILSKLTTDSPVEEWIFNGGEDFELVLCLAPKLARELLSDLGEGAAIIGEIKRESQIEIDNTQKKIDLDLSKLKQGFQHF